METRVLIVDFNHIAHGYYHSQHRLSIRVQQGGQSIVKDTTIQNGTLKCIYNWSAKGAFPTAVCFDRPVPARKAFFQSCFSDMKTGTSSEYKGDRERMPELMYEAISDVERILRNAGVSCFSEYNYESDDLIFACVQRAKEKYPNTPIDIVTNDADLLPLVDEQVSVFLRSKTMTYAKEKEYEKAHYIQVAPENYQMVVENLSAYKGFTMPYNSILLHKLLRGDASDKFGRKDISRMFSAKKWNAMIDRMLEDYVNFEEVFRYGKATYKIFKRNSNGEDTPFEGSLEEAINSKDRNSLYQKIDNSEELDAIIELLSEYSELSEEQLKVVEQIYWGMNLNQVYPNKNTSLSRREYVLCEKGHGDIDRYNEVALQNGAQSLQIRLIKA